MPDTTIIKLKIRRGTDAQRKLIILEQGELGYTTDTKRVFVGDGVSKGGQPVGSVVHSPRIAGGEGRLGLSTAIKGDIVYDTNLIWQLTGTNYNSLISWVNISPKGDGTLIKYDKFNRLTIDTAGLSGVVTSLSATFESPTFTVINNTVTLNPLNSSKISSTALGNGLKGGSGTRLYVNANTSQFGFETGTKALTLTALPANIVTYTAINPSIVGAGLSATNSNIVASLQSVDNTTIKVTNGKISLPVINSGGNTFFRTAAFDTYGRITSVNYAATDTLSGFNTLSNALTVFNGAPNQISSNKRYTNQSIVSALSTLAGTTRAIALTSAGFITFAATNSVSGTAIDRFAIPIYSY